MSPHGILGDKTHEEACIGVNLDIGHFRIFGCPIYSHVPMEKRKNMKPSSEKGIFMGYSDT